jgi:hypothetical protein
MVSRKVFGVLKIFIGGGIGFGKKRIMVSGKVFGVLKIFIGGGIGFGKKRIMVSGKLCVVWGY